MLGCSKMGRRSGARLGVLLLRWFTYCPSLPTGDPILLYIFKENNKWKLNALEPYFLPTDDPILLYPIVKYNERELNE